MDSNEAPLFSIGLNLATLAVSCDILRDSWDAISKLHSQIGPDNHSPPSSETVKFLEVEHQNYTIIAFVTPPVATSYLHENRDLVRSSSPEVSKFLFLHSKSNPSFSINKAVISLFNSLQDKLSPLKDQVATSSESIPHIITGHCLGGSIASLFTLWLLDMLGSATSKRPLCLTFGSPLIGDGGFQQAISQYSTWSSCFLHVAHRDDCFPRLFLPSATEQSPYKPFGTFLLCSESGGACYEAPKSIIVLLGPRRPEWNSGTSDSQILNYGSVIECLKRRLIFENHSAFSVNDADSFKAGITVQVAAIGPTHIQNIDMDALTKSEQDVLQRRNQAFDPAKELKDMRVNLAYLEWYKNKCENDGRGLGYYDSFKEKTAVYDHEVVRFKKKLVSYWERVVEEVEKRPQREGAWMRIRWLFEGTNYRRMVEPLHIADYYKECNRSYISQGRPMHFKLLERWLDERQNQPAENVPINLKMQRITFSATEDSCFWAHVEEAQISCRSLNHGGSNSTVIENLVKFEQYVMRLLKNYAISLDIFLERSSYMQWWGEYKVILVKPMMGASRVSQLALFMDGDYHRYKSGTWNLHD